MSDSDEDHQLDGAAHRKLLAGINSLVRTQDIQAPIRTEPSLKKSEFHVVKRAQFEEDGLQRSKQHSVALEDLLGHLKKTNQSQDVVKDLSMILKGKRKLEKPLEKPVADRISRDALYGKAQTDLDLWEPVVTSMEVAPQMVFPLKYGNVRVISEVPQKLSQYRVKSDLMKAMEELDERYREKDTTVKKKPADKYALTLGELRQQRKEAALQKMRELYKISKNRRLSKIKSKKYHKLQKRDKVRAQIKQFEELQRTDPEAALRQLEAIEKQRYQERATLRHKNTGSWAKNMQIRAKYDMNVRQELAEQLSIGKELMGKRMVTEDDESSESGQEDVALEEDEQGDNPWVRKRGEHEEEANREFTSGYRKYWQQRNEAVEAAKEMEDDKASDSGSANGSGEEVEQEETSSSDSEDEKNLLEFKQKVKKCKAISTTGWEEEDTEAVPLKKKAKKRGSRKEEESLEDLFNDAEELLNQHVEKKLANIRESVKPKPLKAKATRKNRKQKNQSSALAFKKKASLADLDVELDESVDKNANANSSEKQKANILPEVGDGPKEIAIDPHNFVPMKPRHLLNAVPDLEVIGGDLIDDDDADDDDPVAKIQRQQRLTIAEAFEDDDIVVDFEQEKQEERDRNKPKEVDLSLPGWGHWAGAGISQKKTNKTRRKMFKPAPVLPRRDDNKEKVIINEDAVNKNLASHLVNDLPFPFVSVKDYEASLRAPLGRTFIPETAHTTLVEPRVVTKKGTVIEPMKKDILLQSNPGKSFHVGGKLYNKAVRKYEEFLTNDEVAA
ncbi:U3 small nucleolar RNA-associated protein 14 homolog A [Sabethes cyaneus]|uniref:U3 small nucleolar RNA-associated protein 14 homolog A n=1 Tax=Sabethes cyaneus TaxID=53552 RepID=UPI00237EB459|nr:U3 small nucleolar RNA-associated protein 14 homolog A [Sabethes cyaneus]